jgi:hypothetical protein
MLDKYSCPLGILLGFFLFNEHFLNWAGNTLLTNGHVSGTHKLWEIPERKKSVDFAAKHGSLIAKG